MTDGKIPNNPVKAAYYNIVPAFKSAGFYIAVGLVFGFFLVLLASKIKHSEALMQLFGSNNVDVAYLLIEHLGTGFIVSALAVFFYEWGAHIKHALDLSSELNEGVRRISDLVKTTDLSNRLVNVLTDEHTRRGEPEFRQSLEFLLTEGEQPPAYLSDLRENIYSIVMAVGNIRKNNSWATEQYVEFINYLLTNVVEPNARTLEHVSKKQDGEYPFSVPTDGAKMADEILATHMRALVSGDSYEVISHVTSWTRLQGFHAETMMAVKNRGVKIRRVFNFRLRYEEELKPEQIRGILNSHLNDVKALADEYGNKRYEVKVIRQAEIDKAIVSNVFLDLIPNSHFGTFIKNADGNDKSKIRVKVTFSNLSDMTLSSDKQSYKKDIEVFDEAWRIGSDLTPELIDTIIEEWMSKDDLPKQIEKKIAEIIVQADTREQSSAEPDRESKSSEKAKPEEKPPAKAK